MWMTPPHGPHLVCAPSLSINVEMASEDPPPQGTVVGIDAVKVLLVELK